MAFRDYINDLPNVKVDTINEIAALTSTSVATVYKWISGSVKPPLIKKQIIADFLKLSINELWPEDENISKH